MTVVGALIFVELKKLIRNKNLRDISLIFLFFLSSGYFLRLISLQHSLTDYEPLFLGKRLFLEMSVYQALLLIFILLWFYPTSPELWNKGQIFGFPVPFPGLTFHKIFLAKLSLHVIVIGFLISLALPFLAMVYMLGGIDVSGLIRSSLFLLVVGLIAAALRDFWYSFTGKQISASAYSFLTFLLITAGQIYLHLLNPDSGYNWLLYFERIVAPLPLFVQQNASIFSWPSLMGKLCFSICLEALAIVGNRKHES